MREVGCGRYQEQAGRRVVAVIVQVRCQAELGKRTPLTLVQNLAGLRIEMVVSGRRIPAAHRLE